MQPATPFTRQPATCIVLPPCSGHLGRSPAGWTTPRSSLTTDPAMDHSERTRAGTALHAHDARMARHLWLALDFQPMAPLHGPPTDLLMVPLNRLNPSPSPHERSLTEAMHKTLETMRKTVSHAQEFLGVTKRHHEEKASEPARATAPANPVTEPVGVVEKIPKQQSTQVPYVLLDTSALSFVAKPFGFASLDFIRRLVPDQDFDLVKSVPDLAVLEAVNLHFMQALVWTGEAMNRLYQAREKESLRLELEAALADAQSSKALAQSLEAKVQSSEEENKALQTEVKKLQEEVMNLRQLGKEEFLQSKEFDSLCSGRASIIFEQGFNECLAQFRANGYSEEEHPAYFLDVEQALADMPEESKENSSGLGEVPARVGLRCRAGRTWFQRELGLRAELVGPGANKSWDEVPSWCQRELGLSAELVGPGANERGLPARGDVTSGEEVFLQEVMSPRVKRSSCKK
ncbi:hypothetical protein F511_34717 [Dorcoceras hygrometricum]|uniref:Uncharacterized protein n=1 Tax=Dorcoceras hygrometricum TaxID=472368 RepID=A0A2Z7BQM6_9LAMI|nr:hypothetical protein F511_34717 [Dorcoceras hygrometricum]